MKRNCVSRRNLRQLQYDIKSSIGDFLGRSMTYDELALAVSNNELQDGERILISDYQTTHIIRGTAVVNSGAVEPIIVTAIGKNALAPIAQSTIYPKDLIYYTLENNTDLLPGCTKGIITRRIDTVYDIDICYDWRNVKFRRYAVNVPAYEMIEYSKGDIVSVEGVGVYIAIEDSDEDPLTSILWAKIIDLSTTKYWGVSGALANGIAFDITDFEDLYTFNDVSDPANSSGNIDGVQIIRNWFIAKVDSDGSIDGNFSMSNMLNNIVHVYPDDPDSFLSDFTNVVFLNHAHGNESDTPVYNNTFNRISFVTLTGNCDNNIIGHFFDFNKTLSHMSAIKSCAILNLVQSVLTIGFVVNSKIESLNNMILSNSGISSCVIKSLSQLSADGGINGVYSSAIKGGSIKRGGSLTQDAITYFPLILNSDLIPWEIMGTGVDLRYILRYFDKDQGKFRLFSTFDGNEILPV